MVQRIEARAERVLNVSNYDANDVDDEADLSSSDDEDYDDGSLSPQPSSLSPSTVEYCFARCLCTSFREYGFLPRQRRRRLELSVVKDNLPDDLIFDNVAQDK